LNFSICDIPVGGFTFRWFNMDIEREEYPNLRRWYGRLGERTPYQGI
jgi:glutathione S-transferase